MNTHTKKLLMNCLRSGLGMQQICEFENCKNKAEYSITQWHGGSKIVCHEHAGIVLEVQK